jgi:DNA-binding NarL/FixJ family response regulator
MIDAYIIDDHPVSRWGLQRALESAPDVQVTGMFASAEEVLTGWRTPSPDVALVDLYLGDDMPSMALVAELVHRSKVLVVSASRRRVDITACRRAGASGYLHKSSDGPTLVAAVYACIDGHETFPDVEADSIGAILAGLSPRERQVLAHIAGGHTHDQTARRLEVSRHTVDTYVKRLRAKVGLGNKAYLTRIAVDAGITIDPEQSTS